MPLRVTARLACRLGTTAPIHGSSWTAKRTGDPLDPRPSAEPGVEPVGAIAASNAARCSTKCGVRETVPPAIAASYCARVFSRCTAGRRRLRLLGRGSGGQALAALGATGVDHGTAATGLHADQEAVGTRAAHFGRLVGAFHDASRENPALSPKLANRTSKGVVKTPGITHFGGPIGFVDKVFSN